jgi:hypothetical protein
MSATGNQVADAGRASRRDVVEPAEVEGAAGTALFPTVICANHDRPPGEIWQAGAPLSRWRDRRPSDSAVPCARRRASSAPSVTKHRDGSGSGFVRIALLVFRNLFSLLGRAEHAQQSLRDLPIQHLFAEVAQRLVQFRVAVAWRLSVAL